MSADSGHGEQRSGPERADLPGMTVARLRAKPLMATPPVLSLG